MQIVCPACASQYELDAAKLGPAGRKVRCASCQTLWHVEPQEPFPAAPDEDETRAALDAEMERAAQYGFTEIEPPEEPAPAPVVETPQVAPVASPPRGRRARPGGKARGKAGRRPLDERLRGSALPLGLCAAGLVILAGMAWQRSLVVKAAPQLAAVFEAVGLKVNVRGLAFSAVESGLVDDGQGRFLVVEGDVTNVARGAAPLPPIEVAVKDAAGQTLYTWTAEPPRPSLEPAELVRFRTRLAQPPEGAQAVQVRFSNARPIGVAALR